MRMRIKTKCSEREARGMIKSTKWVLTISCQNWPKLAKMAKIGQNLTNLDFFCHLIAWIPNEYDKFSSRSALVFVDNGKYWSKILHVYTKRSWIKKIWTHVPHQTWGEYEKKGERKKSPKIQGKEQLIISPTCKKKNVQARKEMSRAPQKSLKKPWNFSPMAQPVIMTISHLFYDKWGELYVLLSLGDKKLRTTIEWRCVFT